MAKLKRRGGSSSKSNLSIRQHQIQKRGVYYDAWTVQGWKEPNKEGKLVHCKKQFSKESDAKAFMAVKEIELLNEGIEQRTVLTKLDNDQINEAEQAFKSLGDTYTLTQAVEYFLKNHRAPDVNTSLDKAIGIYLDAFELEGARPRSVKARKSVLEQLSSYLENPYVHEISTEDITDYLKSLRSKDGISPATRKTWNNYRNEIHPFLSWCVEADKSTARPYCFQNPCENVHRYTSKQVQAQRGEIITTSIDALVSRMSDALTYKDGALAKYYALTYFAGIRPDGELQGLAQKEEELVNLTTGTITIPASISKTKDKRTVTIPDNLKVWLKLLSDQPIFPKNFDRTNKEFRKKHGFTHDETRHSFISYHVALNRSVGDVALQAGNSEGIVKKHYLKLHSQQEGRDFFSIIPDHTGGSAEISPSVVARESHPTLKAI